MNERLDVEIIKEYDGSLPDDAEAVIRTVLLAAAEYENVENGELAVMLVNDARIHELNKEFRNVDRPTDVLSFPMMQDNEEEPDIFMEDDDDPINALGDIVISIDTAVRQAEEYGHSVHRELGFLAVHGFLHLLGYDHETAEEEREMFRRQEEILKQVQLSRR